MLDIELSVGAKRRRQIRWIVSPIPSWVKNRSIRCADLHRYRVAGYGVRLQHQYSTINDDWYYSFQLQREPGQDSIEMALSHPNPDQLDDWDDYCAEKDLVTEQDFMVFNFDGAGLSKDRIASIDSGYFSNSAPNTG